jgi:hypothetical protein
MIKRYVFCCLSLISTCNNAFYNANIHTFHHGGFLMLILHRYLVPVAKLLESDSSLARETVYVYYFR